MASPIQKDRLLDLARRREDNTDSRLAAGDIVQVSSTDQALVWSVNYSRACILYLSGTVRSTVGADGKKKISFSSTGQMDSISPNSEIPILHRLGKTKMLELLEQTTNQQTNNMSEEKKKAKTEEAKPRLGKLGGFMGFPITAVIRALGVLKWEFWEVKKMFEDHDVTVAENTIRIQLSNGRTGEGEPAAISAKKLKELRPDPSEKPVRAAADKPAKKAAKPDKAAKKAAAADDDEEDEKPRVKAAKPSDDDDDEPAPKPAKKAKAAPAPEPEESEEETSPLKDDDE